ncbi:MAG: hypothetical protein JKY54_17570 [Flavobacteriales bacterium]|nr:hypothetical protein [Flavobacteriales bacterium]
MNITNYIKQLDYKAIKLVFILMGISGGFSILPDGVDFIGKLLFSFYGVLTGLLIILGVTILLNRWNATTKVKTKVSVIFVLLGIAPMFWAYFDFEEHIKSSQGLIIMLIIDSLALAALILLIRKEKLILTLLIIPIWQLINLFWFICLTWKEMNYWD